MPSPVPIWADGASTALAGGYSSRRAWMNRGPGGKRGTAESELTFHESVPGIFGTTFGPTKEGIQHGLQGFHMLALLRASAWESR